MKRSLGIVAMTLGAIGMVLSALGGLWAARLLTGAGDFAADAVSGVTVSLQRVEDRLGVVSAAANADLVQERLVGVRDGFSSASEAASGLSSNPLISLLPVDLEGLEIATGQGFVGDAGDDIEAVFGTAAAGLGTAEEKLDDFSRSLRFWARISAVLLLAAAAWSVWAQYHLTGWGWRAWRANPPEA